MFPIPEKYKLTTGSGEGDTALTAFDAALLDAGLGNYNLVKLSSILPPGARPSDRLREEVPPGSLLPVAYGFITSDQPGQVISAAVAVGLTGTTYGLIMEHKAAAPLAETRRQVTEMVREGLARRGLPARDILATGVECRVSQGKTACAFAAIAMWK